MEYPNYIGPQDCSQGLLQIIFTLRCDDVPQAVNYQPKDNHIGISTSAFPVTRASYYLLTGSVGLERWTFKYLELNKPKIEFNCEEVGAISNSNQEFEF